MALTNCYHTLNEFKSYMFPAGNAGTSEDTQMEAAITAACRAIDTYCGRRFYLDANPSARYYEPSGPYHAQVDEFSTTSGLIVVTDDYDTGTYSTTWTINTDFRLEPANAESDGIGGRPYDEIHSLGTRMFPTGGWRPYRLSVTARWGWAAVPDMVKQASLIQAGHIYRRAKTPDGFAAGETFGAIRISKYVDPDVAMLLGPYRKAGGSGLVLA